MTHLSLDLSQLVKRDRAVVVAVAPVLVVQHVAHEVVEVVSVRYALVTTIGTVHVVLR